MTKLNHENPKRNKDNISRVNLETEKLFRKNNAWRVQKKEAEKG